MTKMSEIERKQLKATVFEMRYEELAEKAKLGLATPEELLTQIVHLENLVRKELARPSKLSLLPYKRLERRIPSLFHYVAVGMIQRDLD